MNWISVKDKLPPEPPSPPQSKGYLTWSNDGHEICVYRGYGIWRSLIHEGGNIEVTHWLDGP
jgi:hypothetical protein